MNRKVLYIRVHDLNALFKGVGNLTGSELPMKNKSLPGLEMVEGLHGVEITFPGVEEIQIVPYPNIQKYDVERSLPPISIAKGVAHKTTANA